MPMFFVTIPITEPVTELSEAPSVEATLSYLVVNAASRSIKCRCKMPAAFVAIRSLPPQRWVQVIAAFIATSTLSTF